MRKLLLLLPALALASCSGGHDLMSNKSFSMTCDALEFFDRSSPWIVATISPELPQASVRVQVYEDKWDESVWRVIVATPTRLELANPGTAAVWGPIVIDRSKGKAGLGDGVAEINQLICSFKTL